MTIRLHHLLLLAALHVSGCGLIDGLTAEPLALDGPCTWDFCAFCAGRYCDPRARNICEETTCRRCETDLECFGFDTCVDGFCGNCSYYEITETESFTARDGTEFVCGQTAAATNACWFEGCYDDYVEAP